MRWLDKKGLALRTFYKRMEWDRSKAWRRRTYPDLPFREAAMMAVACEAPLGPFLVDLAIALTKSPKGREHLDHLRDRVRRRHYPHGTCEVCGKGAHPAKECPETVSARLAVEILRADRLAILGAARRKKNRAKKAART